VASGPETEGSPHRRLAVFTLTLQLDLWSAFTKPLYQQVGEVLKARIELGDLPKDERIPSETELMAEFQIGRTTVRRAVVWLRETGLVEALLGRGTYVL
jgi:DNA-binding GntR family transcriptional regulator